MTGTQNSKAWTWQLFSAIWISRLHCPEILAYWPFSLWGQTLDHQTVAGGFLNYEINHLKPTCGFSVKIHKWVSVCFVTYQQQLCPLQSPLQLFAIHTSFPSVWFKNCGRPEVRQPHLAALTCFRSLKLVTLPLLYWYFLLHCHQTKINRWIYIHRPKASLYSW